MGRHRGLIVGERLGDIHQRNGEGNPSRGGGGGGSRLLVSTRLGGTRVIGDHCGGHRISGNGLPGGFSLVVGNPFRGGGQPLDGGGVIGHRSGIYHRFGSGS